MGGSSNVPVGFVSLTKNVMMIAMAIWMAWLAGRYHSVERARHKFFARVVAEYEGVGCGPSVMPAKKRRGR